MNIILKEIFLGWKNYIFKSPEHEELAKKRINICISCEKFKKNKRCLVCGCFMPAKVRNQYSKCPLKKW